MSSVCDDCMKKCICKPSREYHFACQWKNDGKRAENLSHDDWGLPPLVPTSIPKE